MIPVALYIENFGPFRKPARFYFPSEPGLYFLWGENREEPRLEANGAGKTKLWEALCWVIYGKTPRGLKAGDTANWEAGKGTRVEFHFLMNPNEDVCILKRTWSPNSWTLTTPYGDEEDLSKDASNQVLALLGLDFTPFLYCILMAQSMPMFLDLEADAKASLFSEIMQLDVWLEYSSRAGERAKQTDRELRIVEQKIAQLEGQITATKTASVASESEAWEQEREERLRGLEGRHKKLLANLKTAKAAIPELEDLLAAETEELEKLVKQVEGVKLMVGELQKTYDGEDRELAKIEQAIKSEEDGHQELGDICPLCEQEVDDHQHARLKTNHLKRLEKLEREEAEQKTRLAGTTKELKHWRAELAALSNDLEDQIRQVEQAEQKLKAQRREIQFINRDLDEVEERSERAEQEVNPFSRIQSEEKERVDQLKVDLRHQQYRQDLLSAEVALAQQWVRWFKEIRLEQISAALQQLEIEVNSCLTDLGLVNWELRFDVDRETKKGSIQRGFSVTVLSPHNDKPVPWKAWSGGESQRLRLATNQGLSNLIRARTGTPLALEVWDEPTQHLSAQGVTDLLDSLAERAQKEKRQIWIVDHRTLGYSGFTGTRGVIKTAKDGSFFAPYISQHPGKHLDD